MRESGILMPVSSLPGPYGIGCFGKAAFQFVDFLSAAGQTIWQLLPLSPTGYGDSPYQSCSAFAGNPYFVDLEALEKEGLLTAADLKAKSWGKNPLEVDYGTLYVSRFAVLRKAYAAWRSQCAGLHGCSYYYPDDYYAFTLANEDWLEDYALYMALKVANKMKNWVEWDAPLPPPRQGRTGCLCRRKRRGDWLLEVCAVQVQRPVAGSQNLCQQEGCADPGRYSHLRFCRLGGRMGGRQVV